MTQEIGFDTDLYLKHQVKKLFDRVSRFERLYLEFGGKLFADLNASRCLPGYRPGAKIELIKSMGEVDLFYCVSANDIARGKVRGDTGLTYDLQTVKDVADLIKANIPVTGVVITMFTNQNPAPQLKRRLENLGYRVFFQNYIEGYPQEIDEVMLGYKSQPYIETKNKIVVVTGAGGNSGKMALCLSQIYTEKSRGLNSGYAKIETFPIWNLPINHPVNIAYEAVTADLCDVCQIDPYHLKAYGIEAVNYNRDIENFAIMKGILKKITGVQNPFGYRSPTDMGINMLAEGIVEDAVCQQAAKDEIIRRFFRHLVEKLEGKETQRTVDQISMVMQKAGLKPEDRGVVKPARKAEADAPTTGKGFNGIYCGCALELRDGTIIAGKNSPTLHAESATVLNALKVLAKIPDEIDLISPNILAEISKMKGLMLDHKSPSLSVNETLIVLASCCGLNPSAKSAMEKIPNLRGCELHSTHVLPSGDAIGIRNLGINATSDPRLTVAEV